MHMDMQEALSRIRKQADRCGELTLQGMEELRVSLLGKKGELTALLKGMGGLSPEERPLVGQLVNETRGYVEKALADTGSALRAKIMADRLAWETIDVTVPGKAPVLGHLHPMTLVADDLKDIFIGMGYVVNEGPEIETDYYNFQALNIPANHPVRDEQDTFYVEGGFVLRTQTSGVQVRTMEKTKPPIKMVAPGKCFRSEDVNATHSPVFHQIEGLVVDEGVTMGDLKGSLAVLAREIFGEDTKVRLRPSFFPFTEPSAELDISCFACHGVGCRVCKGSGWVELGGCGMVHPNVLSQSGIDPVKYSGFAFGMGLERIAQGRYGIHDMRLLFENDIRFLRQF